jgi:hypothetical protein
VTPAEACLKLAEELQGAQPYGVVALWDGYSIPQIEECPSLSHDGPARTDEDEITQLKNGIRALSECPLIQELSHLAPPSPST